MLTQRAQDELGLGRQLDGLTQRLRELFDAQSPTLVGRQVVQVLLHRLGQFVPVLDPLQPRLEERGEGQIGIAGWIRAAKLHAGGSLLAGVIQRHADQGRPVAPGPGHVHRGLVSGYEPLVGVDPLGEDRADLPRVAELTGDERLADI